ncbi:hemerythrin domain-containing protein [Piscinibacter terrae]|nr:hemerythrin domain-containing protein [Albitalea terrae]
MSMTKNRSVASKTASKSSTRKSSASADAIRLLTTDHEEVKQMFAAYDDLVEAEAEDEERQALATQICEALTIHATVEEELFYPAARAELEEQDLLDEAEVEHASAKDLIAQIQSMSPSDDLYDAKVKVLGEYIDHHVQEEEGEMFPKVRKSSIDLVALGEEMLTRKQELGAEVETN